MWPGSGHDHVSELLTGDLGDSVICDPLGLTGIGCDEGGGRIEAFEQILYLRRMCSQERRRHYEICRHERSPRPKVSFIDQYLAAGLHDQPGRPRLGKPGTIDLPLLEGGEYLRVVLREDADVAAPRCVRIKAVALQK